MFRVKEKTDIAGVSCLVGVYTQADAPSSPVELGLALSDPVYFLPLLRAYDEEEVVFEMVLTEYTRP